MAGEWRFNPSVHRVNGDRLVHYRCASCLWQCLVVFLENKMVAFVCDPMSLPRAACDP